MVMSMPIVATAVPKMPPTLTPSALAGRPAMPSQWLRDQRDADGDGGDEGGLEADRDAGDDVRRRAGLGRLGDLADRPERARRVVLGDVDERDAGREADDAGRKNQTQVGRPLAPTLPVVCIIT